MTINRMLKFALPAMLLAVSAPAYAADGDSTEPAVVSLANGRGSISWEAFTNAINDHSTIQSDPTEELSPTSEAIRNLNSANTALTNAKTALDDAKTKQDAAQKKADETTAPTAEEVSKANTDLENAKTTESEKSAALETAKAALTTAQNAYIKEFQDQLDNANDSLTKYNAQKTALETNLAEYKRSKETYESQLSTANSTLTSLKAQYDALPKVQGPLPWLGTILTTANQFLNVQNKVADASTINTVLYAKLTTELNDYDEEETGLTISFEKPSDLTGWTVCDTYTKWTNFVKTVTLTSLHFFNINMGSDYAKLNHNNPIISLTVPTTKANILVSLQKTVADLSKEEEYRGDTNEYKNPTQEANLRNSINQYEAEVNRLSILIYGAHPDAQGKLPYGATKPSDGLVDNIKTTESDLETLQPKIDRLNGSVTTEGSIKYYQAAVETAKTAVANDTATSDAITAAKAGITAAQTAYNEAVTGVTNAQNKVDQLAAQQAAYETAQSDLADAEAAVTAAQKTVASAQDDYNHYLAVAQEASDDAAYNKYYKDVTLTGNITAAASGTNYDGTIIGNGNIITVTSGDLFRTFSGTLTKTAINGSFAGNVTGSFRDVVRWNGTNGRYYSDGGVATDYTGTDAFGKLGYALRNDELFGVNFNTGNVVKIADAPSLVYNITVNYFNGNEANTQYYVQNINNTLIAYNKATVEIPTNRFAKSEDEFNFTNVYYGPNNYCSEVKIVDGAQENFYCPVDITTNSIDLNRELTKGYNTVCLPFALTYELINNANILAICNYEREDASRFWFTKVAEGLQANTPLLVVTSEKTGFESLKQLSTTVTIAKTAKTQISKGTEGADGGMSFGTFKRTAAGEFLGQSNMACIYGLNKDGNFQRATANADLTATQAHFPAFRMVLASNSTFANSSTMRAPGEGDDVKGIGILDDNGIDITDRLITGVNNVTVDNNTAALEVVPGQGIITINSEADYGDVAIYSIDGKVAAIANVMAGTTTVNLQTGVYIVLGKKVLVK